MILIIYRQLINLSKKYIMFNPNMLNVKQKNRMIYLKTKKIKNLVQSSLRYLRKELNYGLNQQQSEDSEDDFIEQTCKNHKILRGYTCNKYSINHKEPHLKIIYISKDSKHLCWKSPYKNNEKRIPLSSIKQIDVVNSTVMNPQLKKLAQQQYIQHLIIISDIRNLQFQVRNEEQGQQIRQQIIDAIFYSQKMSNNYIYTI